MKKVIFMLTLIAFFMTSSVISFAQEKGSMMGKGMRGSMMGKAREAMMEMWPMHGMMKMMSKEMVATGDGGVIVMTGNKLMKFDKDLNLVKETEVKMDMEGMCRMMKEMREKCTMCKEMMEKGSMRGSKGSEMSEEISEHESHH